MASVREVAKLSGVSISTVSRVLNGDNQKVSDQTRERVLAAVRELRYRPPARDEGQQSVRTQNIGVLVPDLARRPLTTNLYFAGLYEGILEAASMSGWSTTVFVERMWTDVSSSLRRTYDGHCDGLIAIAPEAKGTTVQAFWERGTPMVFVGTTSDLPQVSSVDIANTESARKAVQRLVDMGHRRIAYVGATEGIVSSKERATGYREAVRPLGYERVFFTAGSTRAASDRDRHLTMGGQEVVSEDGLTLSNLRWGEDLVRRVFCGDDRPTAIIAWNDVLGHDLVTSAHLIGLEVPRDFSVLTYDDSVDAHVCVPPLTTYRQPLNEIGRRSFEMLLKRIDDPDLPEERVLFEPDLIVRESTARLG
jgi:LacI family transcriptional regulator